MTCNGILKPGEKKCYGCGERAPKQQAGPSLRKRIAGLISLALIASLALTGASLVFSDHTPPFTACLTASVVLIFVKRSADQLTGAKS
jgi:hypothetical protein